MAPNIIENKSISCGDLDEERIKEVCRMCFAFLVYGDILKKEPLSLHDNQNVTSCLNETALDKYRTDVYWLWHDLLDVLDTMAPYEQDWINNTQPHEERKHIEKLLLQPDQFWETCWHWLDLMINIIDEVNRW